MTTKKKKTSTKSKNSKGSKSKDSKNKKDKKDKKAAYQAARRIFKATVIGTAGAVAMNSWDPFDLGLNLGNPDVIKFTASAIALGTTAYELWEHFSNEEEEAA